MTLRHMKIFVSVYQNNGITRASEELHLAQLIRQLGHSGTGGLLWNPAV